MFRKKKDPLHAETEAAVQYAIERFIHGGLYGNDHFGWSDAERKDFGSEGTHTLIFVRKEWDPQLIVRGYNFKLTRDQADRISAVIARRVVAGK